MKHLPLYNKQFEELYKEFEKMVTTKGYSKDRQNPYSSFIREFLHFIQNRGITKLKEIKSREIIAYYEYISERPNQRREGGLSNSMIRHHLAALRLFFDYLLDINQIESSPARLPSFQIGKHKERNICTVEEMKQLYAVCENKKEKALLSIAYGCALRRTEMQNLNTSDIHLHKGILIVREGKGNKSRTIPLSDNVVKDLKEYIIYERSNYFIKHNQVQTPAFFINHWGKRMTGDRLNALLKMIIERTQSQQLIQKEITLHSLRHNIATHLIDNGANIEFVQSILGHSEINTAQLYSKRRKQKLKIQNRN